MTAFNACVNAAVPGILRAARVAEARFALGKSTFFCTNDPIHGSPAVALDVGPIDVKVNLLNLGERGCDAGLPPTSLGAACHLASG
jgi:hypothetical protein